MERIVIIGGGVAGLSCLNALLDRGEKPLLLEASTIGTPKMCGEFIAPATVESLKNWDISAVRPIREIIFHVKNKKLTIPLQKPAGAIARNTAEYLLAERARQHGGRIRENSAIQKVIPPDQNSPYRFYLDSGEEIQAKTAIFATGRYGQHTTPPAPVYYGIKFHCRVPVTSPSLMMYSVKDAYFGVVPLADNVSNSAWLIRREAVEEAGGCRSFFQKTIEANPILSSFFDEITLDDSSWLEGRAPEFGLKIIPDWANAFWIGDAMATLHPAIGSGFAHGIASAVFAAECYSRNNFHHYRRVYLKNLRSKLWIGKQLHRILLNPALSSFSLPVLRFHPVLSALIQKKLGYV